VGWGGGRGGVVHKTYHDVVSVYDNDDFNESCIFRAVRTYVRRTTS